MHSAVQETGSGAKRGRADYRSSGRRLSREQERDLARRAQAGDTRARDEMVEANTALVHSIALRYRSPRLETADLIQEGMVGLCRAIQSFDPDRNLRFSTYATYWIRQRILRVLDRSAHALHVPADVHYAARRAGEAREELLAASGHEPSSAAVAEVCSISEERLNAILAVAQEPLTLDDPSAGGDTPALEVRDPQAADPEAELLRSERDRVLRHALDRLSWRERLVLQARFGLDGCQLTLDDLEGRLHVSRVGVRQIQRRALRSLQRHWLAVCPEDG